MKKRSYSAWLLSLACLLVAFGAQAQIPFDLEIGYRWIDISGNEDMYRSQINEDDGLLLRSLWLSSTGGDIAYLDHFRLTASDLGAGPAGTLSLEAGKSNLYNFTFRYREMDAYSALPAFANPLLDQGIIPGQHTFDRTRTMFDADIEWLSFDHFTPFVGFSRNEYDGPGLTTYFIGQDEFQLESDLTEKDEELRVGVGFTWDRIYGQVTQGWRDFSGSETLQLIPNGGNGNNPGTVLDQPVDSTGISRTSDFDVSTPFTNLYVTGVVTDNIKVVGNYVRFEADGDALDTESALGSFVSFPLRRFFDGFSQGISASANNETHRGGIRAEVTFVDGVDLLIGYQSESRQLGGSALIESIYLDSITFGGADRRDLETILNAESALERDEDVFNLRLTARKLGPFAVWAGFAQADQDVTVDQDLSEIVVPGSQEGQFDRSVDTLDFGTSYSMSGLIVSLTFKKDDADDPILRTDFLDRERYRIRAGWAMPSNFLRLGFTVEKTEQDNEREGIGYEGEVRQWAGNVELMPAENIRFYASISRFEADSMISFRQPEPFMIDTSIHTEEGQALESGLNLSLDRADIDVGFSRFDNDGTNPFDLDRLRARFMFDVTTKVGISAEWFNDKYDESSPSWGNYEADRYGLFFRWKQ